jgi:hypothetical protein
MNILGPSVGYTDLLDHCITTHLQAERQGVLNSGPIKYHPLRPSSAGQCSRLLALNLMEYRGKKTYPDKPIIEPHVYRLFDLGHAIERETLRHFQLVKVISQKYKQQVLTFFELASPDGVRKELMEGSCDFVFISKDHRGIGDCKSKKDGFSVAYKTKWDDELAKFSEMESLVKISDSAFYADDLPAFIAELQGDYLVDNLLQLNLYAMNPFMTERGIDHAFLYRLNKNDSRHMEIRFRPSQEVANYVEKKFKTISEAVDADQAEGMSCEFPLGSFRHAYCDCHKMLPYSETDPVRSYWKSLPPKVWPKDTNQISEGGALEEHYEVYKEADKASKKKATAEQEIIQIATSNKISKIRFKDGSIYSVKFLKTPREHFELRKDKL